MIMINYITNKKCTFISFGSAVENSMYTKNTILLLIEK